MGPRLRRLVVTSALLAAPATAQDTTRPATSAPARVPFKVGERL